MQKIGTIDIVNVPYTLYFFDDFKEINERARERDKKYLQNPKEQPLDGYCDYCWKEICVYCDENTSPYYFNNTILHEISHAVLYEMGYSGCDDEELMDKLAKWIPFITRAFKTSKEMIENAKDTKEGSGEKPDQGNIPVSE